MNPKRANRTLSMIVIICGVIACLVIANILYTMTTSYHFRSGIYVDQYSPSAEKKKTITAARGYIYDRNKEIIAQDVDTYSIYAIIDPSHMGIGDTPEYVMDPQMTSEKIAPILDVSVEYMMERFENAQANNAYQLEFGLSGKSLSTTQKEAIDALDLPGIEFSKNSKRFYPSGKFASHLVGYAQYDDTEKRIVGKMGVEQYLDEYLKGTDGEERYSASASGTVLPGTKYVSSKAVNGNDVYLTLDKNVQVALEKCLENTMKKFDSQRAWAVVMEVETGKILGYSSYPTFDLNELEIEDHLNVPSQYTYEPGSVMKGITYAAAIDSGNYPGNDTLYSSNTFYMGIDANGHAYRTSSAETAESTITDALGYKFGTISLMEGFARSSNIAICEMLTKYLPTDVYEEYMTRFGFFQKVNMEGVSEEAGTKNFTYPIEKLTAGFGQGSSVTAMQMVQAYSALFNDGKMMKPYYIDKVVNSYNGDILEEGSPEVVGEPISKDTADQMRALMNEVVNNKTYGSAYNRYHMDDVEIIGKTGTGQIATNGKYGDSTYINSFMAAAPYDDPKVMMYYVFESGNILTYTGDYFKSAFRQALIATGVSGDTTGEYTSGEYSSWQEYEMPTLLNHTLDYANEKLKSMAVNKVVIGDGSSIVQQYPLAQDSVITKQNVFLLTDGTNITMPNMSGWSLKDVNQFAAIANVNITWEGTGSVKEQSVKAGTTINSETEIKLTLK